MMILLCLPAFGEGAANLQKEKFDRGIDLSHPKVFIPKGTLGGGLTVSYNTMDLGEAASDAGFSLLSLLTGISGDYYNFGVAPVLSYFVTDNFAVGARFNYSKTSVNIGNLGLSIADLVSLGLQDYHYLGQNYSTSLTGRYYIPIADSKRFGLFAEARLTALWGQSKAYKVQDGKNYGTYQKSIKGSLDIVPGISIFAANFCAVEVAVGVLGFNYKHVTQTTNQVDISESNTSGLNFKINLLTINLGVVFYLQDAFVKKAGK